MYIIKSIHLNRVHFWTYQSFERLIPKSINQLHIMKWYNKGEELWEMAKSKCELSR